MKRLTGSDRQEDAIDQELLRMIQEVIAKVKRECKKRMEYKKRGLEGIKWSDVSNLALGEVTVEDAAWL